MKKRRRPIKVYLRYIRSLYSYAKSIIDSMKGQRFRDLFRTIS